MATKTSSRRKPFSFSDQELREMEQHPLDPQEVLKELARPSAEQPMTHNSDEPFKVVWSEKLRETARRRRAKAAKVGLKVQFLTGLQEIAHKLARQPLSWGDPYFRLHSSGMILCHGRRAG